MRFPRRSILSGAALLFAGAQARSDGRLSAAELRAAVARDAAQRHLMALEAEHRGRLGVAVQDTGSGARLEYRAGERFPLCSTYKLLAVAAVLHKIDAGEATLEHRIPYTKADLDLYAPITEAHVAEGSLSLSDLCAAAMVWNDHTAGNLILDFLGGPVGVTDYVRPLGDGVTRLDRSEPSLDSAFPNDLRDTTTPAAFLADMRRILIADALSPTSRALLEGWLRDNRMGDRRLRAGLPRDWRVGDKTGSGGFGTANTVAILRPPGRAPLLAAVFYTGSSASADARNALHAAVARIIVQLF